MPHLSVYQRSRRHHQLPDARKCCQASPSAARQPPATPPCRHSPDAGRHSPACCSPAQGERRPLRRRLRRDNTSSHCPSLGAFACPSPSKLPAEPHGTVRKSTWTTGLLHASRPHVPDCPGPCWPRRARQARLPKPRPSSYDPSPVELDARSTKYHRNLISVQLLQGEFSDNSLPGFASLCVPFQGLE